MSLFSHLPPPDDGDGLPSYRQKPRPIGFDLAFKLDGDVLEIDSTRKVDRVRLTHVEQVRFTFKPGNIAATGYVTTLRLTDGKTVTIGDTSWRSMVEIERGGERYVRFIRALCEAIRRASPQARFVAGKPKVLWLVFACAAALAVAMMGLFTAGAWAGGHQGAFWLGLLIVAVASWQAVPLVWLNRPLELPAGEPPEHLLPKPEKP
jgi:hypothetical protein